MDYLDKNDSGEVEVEEIIRAIFTSVPASFRKVHS